MSIILSALLTMTWGREGTGSLDSWRGTCTSGTSLSSNTTGTSKISTAAMPSVCTFEQEWSGGSDLEWMGSTSFSIAWPSPDGSDCNLSFWLSSETVWLHSWQWVVSGYRRFILTVLIPSSSWASRWTSVLKSFLDCDSVELDSALAHTNVSPFARARNICCGHKKCFWFCSETFCVRNKCFPISLRWLTYIVNSVDKTKLSCNTPTDAAPQFL